MHLNIAQKIFSIAAMVLVMMAAVAVYSIQLTARISGDLHAISQEHLPVAIGVSHINALTLEQGLLLQRLFNLQDAHISAREAFTKDKARFVELGEQVSQAFERAHGNLIRGDETPLAQHLQTIEGEYKTFEAHGWKLLQAREAEDRETFARLLTVLNARQDAIYVEIDNLHRHMVTIAEQAVSNVDRDERNLLIVNTVLTVLALVLALTFAAIVSSLMVRAVRNLVSGAEQVQNGELDTEVPVTTHDEVGRLTSAFNSMVGGLRLKERIKDTFGKYLDPRIVSNLLENPDFTNPGGEKREMTVMFIDLKGFTSISEVLPPDVLVDMVNAFFGHMGEAIAAHQGVIDKYMGDAVMAYWGAPFCGHDEHATLACRAAIDALKRFDAFHIGLKEELERVGCDLNLDVRIGISSGDMIVGTIGSKTSRNFTVMGDPVNLGSRLEGANKAYKTRILASQRTWELTQQSISMREIDIIRVKGKHMPVRVYEVLNPNQKVSSLERGISAYRKQDWDGAEAEFSSHHNDATAQMYLDRVHYLRKTPPSSNWDGVWAFDAK